MTCLNLNTIDRAKSAYLQGFENYKVDIDVEKKDLIMKIIQEKYGINEKKI